MSVSARPWITRKGSATCGGRQLGCHSSRWRPSVEPHPRVERAVVRLGGSLSRPSLRRSTEGCRRASSPDRRVDCLASRCSAAVASGRPSPPERCWPKPGSPVVDMIDVTVRSRWGCSIAIVCTIIPPIEAPAMWARSMSSASSTAMPSAAMSESVYGTGHLVAVHACVEERGHVERDAIEVGREPAVAVVVADDEVGPCWRGLGRTCPHSDVEAPVSP